MNDKFDELAKGLAQSITRRGALKKFGHGLAALLAASLSLADNAKATNERRKFRCQCKKPPYWGCTTQDCFDACQLYCTSI
jgi:hypothetical protein